MSNITRRLTAAQDAAAMGRYAASLLAKAHDEAAHGELQRASVFDGLAMLWARWAARQARVVLDVR